MLMLLMVVPVAVANIHPVFDPSGNMNAVSLAGLISVVFWSPSPIDQVYSSDPFASVVNRYNGLSPRYSGTSFDFTLALLHDLACDCKLCRLRQSLRTSTGIFVRGPRGCLQGPIRGSPAQPHPFYSLLFYFQKKAQTPPRAFFSFLFFATPICCASLAVCHLCTIQSIDQVWAEMLQECVVPRGAASLRKCLLADVDPEVVRFKQKFAKRRYRADTAPTGRIPLHPIDVDLNRYHTWGPGAQRIT